MKKLLTIILIFAALTTQAKIRYVSSSTGNDSYSGLSTDSAWASLAKVSSVFATTFAAGDTLLLKRGDVFIGPLAFNKSGTITKPMYLDTYGTGANPVISGLSTLTSWTQSSGNIYYTSLNVSQPNLIMLNGIVQGKGRYPNTGYLSYEGHYNSNTTIRDRQLTNIPNWTGGEVVIKKYRWILDKHNIADHTDSNITFTTILNSGNSATAPPVDGNGYFIQNHLSALDQNGEWSYDTTAKRLYMYFGTGSPTGNTVQASIVQNLFVVNSLSYFSFNNLDIEGSNFNGVNLTAITGITFNNCNFRNHGGNGLYSNQSTDLLVNNCTFTNCLNDGLWVEIGAVNCKVTNSTFTNIGMIAGMGKSGDAAQCALVLNGNGTTVTNSVVRKAGYNGIQFNGNNALIQNNYVDSVCLVKDDGGGIYTYGSTGVTYFNRIVRNNLVINSLGYFPGNEAFISFENYGKAAAVYLDGNSNNVEITDNTLANGEWGGIFINNNKDNIIKNNLIYNFPSPVYFYQSANGNIRNITMTGNRFIAKTATQATVLFHLKVSDNPSLFGTFNNNFYARPVDDSATIRVWRDYSVNAGGGTFNYTLANWKSTFSQDANSSKSSTLTSSPNNLRFDFNGSAANATKNLTGNYKDVFNNNYSGTHILPPNTGRVLIPYNPVGGKKILVINGKIVVNPTGKILTTF